MIEIDFRQLSPEAFDNLLTEIVLREGTDYGEGEFSTEKKKNELKSAIVSGKAVMVYNADHDFCYVIAKEKFSLVDKAQG